MVALVARNDRFGNQDRPRLWAEFVVSPTLIELVPDLRRADSSILNEARECFGTATRSMVTEILESSGVVWRRQRVFRSIGTRSTDPCRQAILDVIGLALSLRLSEYIQQVRASRGIVREWTSNARIDLLNMIVTLWGGSDNRSLELLIQGEAKGVSGTFSIEKIRKNLERLSPLLDALAMEAL